MSEANWVLKRIANENEIHILTTGETTMGRGTANKIQCPSLMVSRHQCIITLKSSGSIYLRDLDSANGTFINAEKSLKKRDVPLMEGDVIGLGVDNVDSDHKEFFFKLCKVPLEANENEERKAKSLLDLPLKMLKSEEIFQIDQQEKSETINSIVGSKLPATALLSEVHKKEEKIKIDQQEKSGTITSIVGSKRHASPLLSDCPSKLIKLSDGFPSPKVEKNSKVQGVNCNTIKNNEDLKSKMSSNTGVNISTDINPSEVLKLGQVCDKPSEICNGSDDIIKVEAFDLTNVAPTKVYQAEIITLSDSDDDDLLSAMHAIEETMNSDCVNSIRKSSTDIHLATKEIVENKLTKSDSRSDKQNGCNEIQPEVNPLLAISNVSLASSNVKPDCLASKICKDAPISTVDVEGSKSPVHPKRPNFNQGISSYCGKSASEFSEKEESNCMMLTKSRKKCSVSEGLKNGQCKIPLESDLNKHCSVTLDKSAKAEIKDVSGLHSSYINSSTHENDDIPELSKLNETVVENDDFNKDLNNQVHSGGNKSNEYNTKDNLNYQSNNNVEIVIKQEETSFLSTRYTSENGVIFINSDDEMDSNDRNSSSDKNNKNDDITVSELSKHSEKIIKKDDCSKDSNNQVDSVINKSSEYNTENNEDNEEDIVIKEEETSFLPTCYTLDDEIIFIQSDDEMPHSQIFDDPDILTRSNDIDDKVDDQLAEEDNYNNMVFDVDEESEEDEWFQKLSQQFIGKEDILLEQRSPEDEEEAAESSFEKIDRESDKTLKVEENYVKEETRILNNQVELPVSSTSDRKVIQNEDLNNIPSSVDGLKKRKSSTTSDSESKKAKHKIKDKDKSSGNREDKRSVVDKRKKGKSSSVKESSKHNKGSTSKLNKISIENGEIQSHKDVTKASSKSKTVSMEDDDDDDPLKYAAFLCDTLARDAEEKRQIQLKNELDEIKQNEVKKKTIPPRRTLSTEALPEKRRISKCNPETVSTKQCYQSSDKNSTKVNKERNNLKIKPAINAKANKDVKELRKAKLKELSEKNRATTSSESKVPKPSTSIHVKLTTKNRSAFLVDDFVKDPKCVNNKIIIKLGDYKIPRRGSTDQCVESDKTNDSNSNESHYQDDSTLKRPPALPCRVSADQSIEKNKSCDTKSIENNQQGDFTLQKQSNFTHNKKSIIIPRKKSSSGENEVHDTNTIHNDVNKLSISSGDIGHTSHVLNEESGTNCKPRSILKQTNNSKPFIPQQNKKRVQFKNEENLVKTRYIRFSETSLRKPVKKDAAMPSKTFVRKLQQQQANSSHEVFDYYHQTLFDICRWSTSWIEEQKIQTEPPPVFARGTIMPCKDEYVSYKDYRSSIYPLLLCELWANICKALEEKRPMIFDMAIENPNHRPPTVIKVIDPDNPNGKDQMSLVQIYCQILLDGDALKNNNFPHYGDIVVAEFFENKISKKKESQCYMRCAFGYITRAVPIRIKLGDTHVHPDLKRKQRNSHSLLNLDMTVRQLTDSVLEPARLGKIRIAKNIISDLRLFRALDNLPRSLLMPRILSPNDNKCIANGPVDLPALVSYENAPILNESQKKAVLMTAKLCIEDSHNLHFIHGPPGTGKSQVIVSLVMQIWLTLHKNPKSKEFPRILLCAPSNAAIDEILMRLMAIRQRLGSRKFGMIRNGRSETAHRDVKCLTLDSFRSREVRKTIDSLEDQEYHNIEIENLTAKVNSLSMAVESLQKNQGLYAPEVKRERIEIQEKKLAEAIRKKKEFINQIENKKIDPITIKRISAEAEMKLLEGANIVATTLSSCYNSLMEKAFSDPNKRFSCCIIDEATQATEADTLIPLLLRVNNVVLVGDPKQLPAIVKDTRSKKNGLDVSLFSRHRMWWKRREDSWDSKNMIVHFLKRQYRMHPAIAQWPSEHFYEKKLESDERMESLRRSPLMPFVVLSHDHKQDQEGELNAGEAVMVQNLVWCIRSVKKCKGYSIGVITPYKRHQKSLGDCFTHIDCNEVEVGTVDNFQGRERDIIIFSCVRTEGIGFLQDIQRLNVALTRARVSLIVCGNFQSLQRDETWASLLKNAKERNLYKHISSTRNISFDMIRRNSY